MGINQDTILDWYRLLDWEQVMTDDNTPATKDAEPQQVASDPFSGVIPRSAWLVITNMTTPGYLTIDLEVNGVKREIHLSSPAMIEDGNIGHHHNLSWLIAAARSEADEVINALEIVIKRQMHSDELFEHPFNEDMADALRALQKYREKRK